MAGLPGARRVAAEPERTRRSGTGPATREDRGGGGPRQERILDVRASLSLLSALALPGLTACGGSPPAVDEPVPGVSDPEDEERARANAELDRLRAEEPESPYRLARRRAFDGPGGCGQGPYRLRYETLGARYGERMSVHACAPRQIAGSYRVQSESWARTEERSFGYSQDNARCVAGAVHHRSGGAAGGAPDGAGAGDETGRGTPGVDAEAETAPTDLAPVEAAAESCPRGTSRVPISMDRTFSTRRGAPLEAGAEFELTLWSRAPNDLAGVIFVVEQHAVRDDMTDEAWDAYSEAWDAWSARYRAALDRQTEAGHLTIVDRSPDAAGPPPPPRAEDRPPRPSVNAEWVPGYWHHEARWAWIAGFWRVPEADVRAELTVEAPRAPPPPRDERGAQQDKPAREAVWTPGYWHWDGARFSWVAGAWRIPPSPQHRWAPAAWIRGRAGLRLVPGGWTR